MTRMRLRGLRPRALTVATTFAIAAVGCTGATPPAGPSRTASSSASSSTSNSPSVPNPFTVTAQYGASSLGLRKPIAAGIAIGPDGNLYVADSSQRVTVVSPQGTVLRRWGTAGPGPGQFDFISYDPTDPRQLNSSVAVGQDGEVYVIDSGNDRVEVFSQTGKFIRQFAGAGGKGRQLVNPDDVAVDPAGDVFVVDTGGLSKFSPTGAFEWTIGGYTITDPDLSGFLHIVNVDAHGRVVATDEDARKVVYIDEKGHKVDAFGVGDDLPPGTGACSVTVNGSGSTVVEDCGLPRNTLVVYDRSHRLIGAWDDCHLLSSPRFGPRGEAFALADDGSILKLRFTSAGA
jgi:streptogramin lyase